MRVLAFLLFAGLMIAAVPARAQNDEIRIVQPDGSVVVVKIPTAPPPQAAPPVPGPEDVRAKQQSQTQEPQDSSSGNHVPYASQRGPEPAPVAKSAKAAKKKKPEPEKSYKAESIGRIKPEPEPTPPALPPGAEITRDMAVTIALQHAPPAGSMSVVKRTLSERQVFVVTFRTENGPVDVLVDSHSGEIVKP